MKSSIKIVFIFLSIMFTAGVIFALPQVPKNMDGDHTDWTGNNPATCFADEGGVDETKLDKADITEYCLHMDPRPDGGLYLLMAMDDTEPNKANARIVIDVDGDRTPDYSINNMLNYHSQNGLTAEGVSVNQCTDSSCSLNKLTPICDNNSHNGSTCIGATEGFNNDWPSKFTSGSCDGANCNTQDGYMEIFVPWQYLGGNPPDRYLFGLYLSAQSGGTEDTSADVTGNGLACDSSGCYESNPSAVSLHSFSGNAASKINPLFGLTFLLMLILGSVPFMKRQVKRIGNVKVYS